MRNNHNVNARISSVNRKAGDEFQYKSFAEDGVHFLTGTSAAPSGHYYGFYVLADAVVSGITYLDESKNSSDITGVTSFPAGVFIPIGGGFSTITLTSGEVMLLKFNSNK